MENHSNQIDKRRSDLMQPKNDIIFQALFARGKESITKSLLQNILKTKIDKLELDKSKDLLNDNKENKNGRLDLRAVINGNIECDIEVQLEPHEKMLERFLYYWAKMYTANLKIGEEYKNLRKTISIIIVDSEIPMFKEIKKAHTKWQIREEENQKIILTSYLEFHIIEIPKAIKEYKNKPHDGVLQWMMFLDNPRDEEVTKIMEENKDIKEAKEELDKISQDDILWRMALKAEITRMDQVQREEDATKRGKKIGEEIGRKETKENIIKKLYETNMPVEQISEIVELDIKEVKSILNIDN